MHSVQRVKLSNVCVIVLVLPNRFALSLILNILLVFELGLERFEKMHGLLSDSGNCIITLFIYAGS